MSVRAVLDRRPNIRGLLLQDYAEAFSSLRKAEGIGPHWAQRTSQSNWNAGSADRLPPGSRAEGRPAGRAAGLVAIGSKPVTAFHTSDHSIPAASAEGFTSFHVPYLPEFQAFGVRPAGISFDIHEKAL